MTVLLIQPPIDDFYITPIRTYPLGPLYIAAELEAAGLEVVVLDCLNPPKRRTIKLPKALSHLKAIFSEKEVGPIKLYGSYARYGLSNEEILEKVRQVGPELIAVSCNFTAYFDTAVGMIEAIKRAFPNIPVAIGGYHANLYQAAIRKHYPFIDYINTGATAKDLLAVLGKTTVVANEKACDLLPSRHLIKAEDYCLHRQPFTFIIGTRGCPHHCSFCTVSSLHGLKFVIRKTKDILAEMIACYQQQGIRVFDFEDDNLTADTMWFRELLSGIVKTFQNKPIRLYAMNGVSLAGLQPEDLALMWAAGFRNLNVSLVTAQDKEKRALERPFLNEDFERLIPHAISLGYDITVYFILGLPQQNRESLKATFDYLRKWDVLLAPSLFYPPPGAEMMASLGVDDQNPEQWPLFRSTALACETPELTRQDRIEMFLLTRLFNFKRQLEKQWGEEMTLEILESKYPLTIDSLELPSQTEEAIGGVQLKHFYKTGIIQRIYRT